MELQKYKVDGTYFEKDYWKPYSKVISAPNEKLAYERIYQTIGSKHRLKRQYIKIDSVTVQE
ncbi:MAG: 50S ribosomal protein L18a [Methanomicrobiales archaeon]|jgi:large subunit ribosomal protein LX|nr:50S ribosomal protein L18a [Methanomicrobiales archaeon]